MNEINLELVFVGHWLKLLPDFFEEYKFWFNFQKGVVTLGCHYHYSVSHVMKYTGKECTFTIVIFSVKLTLKFKLGKRIFTYLCFWRGTHLLCLQCLHDIVPEFIWVWQSTYPSPSLFNIAGVCFFLVLFVFALHSTRCHVSLKLYNRCYWKCSMVIMKKT